MCILGAWAFFIFVCINGFFSQPATARVNSCDQERYRTLIGDPFFESAWYPSGPSKGQCADLHPGVRLPKPISVEEAAAFLPYRSDRDLVVANVIVDGVSYLARIPLDAKLKVTFMKDFFRYPASHGGLLFEFENGFDVIEQRRVSGKTPKKMKYLLYGITGVLPKGEKMSLEEAFWRAYRRVMIARVVEAFPSIEKFVQKEVPSRRLEVLPMNASSEQALSMLLAGIRRAARRGYRDFFSGLNWNCIHDTFQVIDMGLGLRLENGDAGNNSLPIDVNSSWEQLRTRFPFLVESMLVDRNLWVPGKSKIQVLRVGSW